MTLLGRPFDLRDAYFPIAGIAGIYLDQEDKLAGRGQYNFAITTLSWDFTGSKT